jgi:NAD-dependent SIR2 family protein deacetylase
LPGRDCKTTVKTAGRLANGAGVPVALGFPDYRRKVGGFGPTFEPTGNSDADLTAIRNFYRYISGKYPLQESRQAIAPKALPTTAA